jgi:UDP:flavonoid glycosyltransferase YjiC (YdhE family)
LIIPTFSERESNARRLAALGIAELQIPTVDGTGEKHISTSTFEENVEKILTDISYKNNSEAVSKLMAKYDELGTVVERIEALL